MFVNVFLYRRMPIGHVSAHPKGGEPGKPAACTKATDTESYIIREMNSNISIH